MRGHATSLEPSHIHNNDITHDEGDGVILQNVKVNMRTQGKPGNLLYLQLTSAYMCQCCKVHTTL
jgi:hypothetical protein